jgi:hypothetical protein
MLPKRSKRNADDAVGAEKCRKVIKVLVQFRLAGALEWVRWIGEGGNGWVRCDCFGRQSSGLGLGPGTLEFGRYPTPY